MGIGRHAQHKKAKKGNCRDKLLRAQAQAATAAAEAATAEAAARTAAEKQAAAAEARKRSSELKQTQLAVRKRREKRHERDGTVPPGAKPRPAKPTLSKGPKTRRPRAEKVQSQDRPGVYATAAGRNTAFAREGRTADAVRQAAERQVRKAAEPIKQHLKKGRRQKAEAMLGGLVRDPAVRPLLRAAGVILSEDSTNDTLCMKRAAAILGDAGAGAGAQTYQDSRAVDLAAKLFAPDDSPRKQRGGRKPRIPQPAPASEAPASSGKTPGFSLRAIARRLEWKPTAGVKRLKKGFKERRKLTRGEEKAYLIDMTRRVAPRLAPDLFEKIIKFVTGSPYVRVSPLPKDTLLIRGEDGKKDVPVPRLLLEIGIPEFFQVWRQEHGEIVQETKFGELVYELLPNLRRLTKRFESCGCPECIEFRGLHGTLVHWRGMMKARLGARRGAASYKPPDHSKPSFAVSALLRCPSVRGVGIPPAKCWMQRGCSCGGKDALRR